jgi:hypothetical protein
MICSPLRQFLDRVYSGGSEKWPPKDGKGQLEVWFGRLLLGPRPGRMSFLRADLSAQTPETMNSNRELKA